jgi:protein-disulfide isomerase
VRAVLFFSPGCPHCQTVLTEVLPPLSEQYGERLLVWKIDVTQPGGVQLYRQAVEALQVPNDRLGVPTLIIGDQVLVGANEIPQLLPGLIEQVLAQGGVDWPAVPALAEGK